MADPNKINSVSSRIDGMQIGNKQVPKQIGTYKYHFKFKKMEDGYQLMKLVAPNDQPSIVTTEDRPNQYLVYNPNDPKNELTYHSWSYWEYATCENGYYGLNYYLFGSGKITNSIPDMID